MRTKEEVMYAFTPVLKLNEKQRMCLLRLEKSFQEIATDILEYAPESADRTSALRKILESKFMCAQAITHEQAASDQVKAK